MPEHQAALRIRRGTCSSVNVLVRRIRDYINSWNENAKPWPT
ncbi:hypothetical protein ACFWIJ_16205 [Streptomyces sp. NPDC127079]